MSVEWEMGGTSDMWDAVYASECKGYTLLGYRETDEGVDALYERPDGNQETFIFDEDGYAVDGELLGQERGNDNYQYIDDLIGDGYTPTPYAEHHMPCVEK